MGENNENKSKEINETGSGIGGRGCEGNGLEVPRDARVVTISPRLAALRAKGVEHAVTGADLTSKAIVNST